MVVIYWQYGCGPTILIEKERGEGKNKIRLGVDCGRALSASAFADRRHVELSWARAARRGLRGLRELQAGVCFSICMGRSVGRSIYMGRFVALALTLAMAVDSDSKPVARVIITVPIIVAAATFTVVVAGAG